MSWNLLGVSMFFLATRYDRVGIGALAILGFWFST